jgi:large subunit ribosomal protein L15
VRQDELHPAPGSRKAARRVGRGLGSGHGAYCGRGSKGQRSRSGVHLPRGFEGGQIPLHQRLPQKRGFTNIFRVEYSLVSLGKLNAFEPGSEVTPEILRETGLVKSLANPIKILAKGEIDRPLTVKANKFSATAREKIEAAGGKVEELEHATDAK